MHHCTFPLLSRFSIMNILVFPTLFLAYKILIIVINISGIDTLYTADWTYYAMPKYNTYIVPHNPYMSYVYSIMHIF